jgi:hypothetical protein
MKKLLAVACLALVTACATSGNLFGPTPEAQIVTGANAITATVGVATVLLKNDKITVVQAKGYRAIIGAADDHLKATNARLVDCRKTTGSTSKANPDPCKATIADDIQLVLTTVGEVQKTLDTKK